MKRIIITIVIVILGIGCGFGAFFMLRTGTDIKQQELEKAELIGLEDIKIEKGSELPDTIYHIQGNTNVTKAEVDVTAVDTSKVGTYPIKYTYYDKNKKKYNQTIKCTIYEKKEHGIARYSATLFADRENRLANAANSTQKTIPPQTGDGEKILILSVLLGTSITAICVCIYKLLKKGEDRI